MNKIRIVGAGMAGLLAANMLRRHKPTLIERQPSLPDNHSALLRFRSSGVSEVTGIPFKKVLVRKGIWTGKEVVDKCTIPLANVYSSKVTEAVESRSIWKMDPEERFISPADFITQMARTAQPVFDHPFDLRDSRPNDEIVISTLPMPAMMKMTGYDFDLKQFQARRVHTFKCRIDSPAVNVYQTIYNASYDNSWYRLSIHGDRVTVESSGPYIGIAMAGRILKEVFCIGANVMDGLMGQIDMGKITPIDEASRRAFLVWLTENYNIYSLGRFATWRPLLLDDLVQDVRRIEQMIDSSYAQKLAASR